MYKSISKRNKRIDQQLSEMLEMKGKFLQKCNKFLFSGLCKFPPEIKEIIF